MLAARRTAIALALASTALAATARADPTVSDDGTIEVVLPDDWATTTFANAPGKIQAKSVAKDAYTLVVSEAKEDLTAKTVDDYAATIMKLEHDAGKIGDLSVTGSQKLRFDGHDARLFTVHGTVKNVKIIFLKYFIESKQHWNYVNCWSTPSHFDHAKGDCAAIAKSFRELPQ
jgi:hypothetical protein